MTFLSSVCDSCLKAVQDSRGVAAAFGRVCALHSDVIPAYPPQSKNPALPTGVSTSVRRTVNVLAMLVQPEIFEVCVASNAGSAALSPFGLEYGCVLS